MSILVWGLFCKWWFCFPAIVGNAYLWAILSLVFYGLVACVWFVHDPSRWDVCQSVWALSVAGAISGIDSILNCLTTTDNDKKNRRIGKEKPVSKSRIYVSIKKINTEISAQVAELQTHETSSKATNTRGPPRERWQYDKLHPDTSVCAAPRSNTHVHTTFWKYRFYWFYIYMHSAIANRGLMHRGLYINTPPHRYIESS
jgi:hypothetical protein